MADVEVDPMSDARFVADVFARDCGSREVLQNLTGRWGLLAVLALSEGDFRFNALRRRVDGVSERMLSQTLQTLERDGFVTRTVLQAIPPRVEYSLTDLGRAVAVSVQSLVDQVEAAVPEVSAARERYDAASAAVPPTPSGS